MVLLVVLLTGHNFRCKITDVCSFTLDFALKDKKKSNKLDRIEAKVFELKLPENKDTSDLDDLYHIPGDRVKAEYNFLRLPYFLPKKPNSKSEQNYIKFIETCKLPNDETLVKKMDSIY